MQCADAITAPLREILMRIPALAILTIFMGLTAAPAMAQTYSGNYPFCLQLYLRDGARSIDCRFSSLEQCQATASGIAATCMMNPYARETREPANPPPRRY